MLVGRGTRKTTKSKRKSAEGQGETFGAIQKREQKLRRLALVAEEIVGSALLLWFQEDAIHCYQIIETTTRLVQDPKAIVPFLAFLTFLLLFRHSA